jgi:hypothetical protein
MSKLCQNFVKRKKNSPFDSASFPFSEFFASENPESGTCKHDRSFSQINVFGLSGAVVGGRDFRVALSV